MSPVTKETEVHESASEARFGHWKYLAGEWLSVVRCIAQTRS